MAKVTFRNIFDEDSKFKEIEAYYLLPAVCLYAQDSDDEIYDTIMNDKVILYVNKKAIHPDDWATFKIKKDDEIIISPKFGKGDLGAWIQIGVGALLVGLAIWQPAFFTAGISALHLSATGVGLFGAALALSGISALLFEPDLPQIPSASSGISSQSQTYSWNGIRTMARVDTPIPVIYGTHKVGGNVISLYTERQGEDDYLNMLIALGEGEIEGICCATNYNHVCQTSNPSSTSYCTPAIEIDDQPIDVYSDLQWWYRTGTNASDVSKDEYYPFAQNIIPYFGGAVVQYDDGREITSDGVIYRTTKEVDMATVQIYAPTLYEISGGNIIGRSVTFKVAFRKEGDPNWIDLAQYQDKWTINSNTYLEVDSYSDGSTEKIVPHNTWNPGTLTISILDIWPDTNFEFGAQYYYLTKDYKIRVSITDNLMGRTEERIINHRITREKIIREEWSGDYYVTYVDWSPTEHRPEKFNFGNYNGICLCKKGTTTDKYGSQVIGYLRPNISIGNSYTISSSYTTSEIDFSISGTTKTGLWKSMTLDFNSLGGASGKQVYEIKVWRPYGDRTTSMQAEDNIILKSVIERINGNFIYPNTALLGLRIKATEQLSGQPPNVTTVVKGIKVKVPDLERSSPSGTDITFNDCYYNKSLDRWETVNATEVYWNDTDSWRTEYSNNPMCCVRDIVLNKRYGLGEYLEEDDLHTTTVTNVIQECSATYTPYEKDYLDWWNSGDASEFGEKIQFTTVSGSEIVNTASRLVQGSSARIYELTADLNSPLIMNRDYNLSFTIEDSTSNVNVYFYTLDPMYGVTVKGNLMNLGNGTHSVTFNTPMFGKNRIMMRFEGVSGNVNLKITDVSIVPTYSGKKLHWHEWDGVLDRKQAALSLLLEMCDSFRTWPVWYGGKFGFIYDSDDTPIHTLTVSNMNDFNQQFMSLSEIPYRLIGQFSDADNKWELRSLMAKASPNLELSKINEKTIGLKGITNRKRASRELKWKLDNVINRNLTVNFKTGLDAIHANAGDIIYVQDDLPSWGQGGRITNSELGIPSPPSNGLIGYWKFDEGTGTIAVDSSSNNNNGSLQNMEETDWVDGISGKCLQFDGNNEYVTITHPGGLSTFTVAAWIKPSGNQVDGACIVADKYDGSVVNYAIFFDERSSIRGGIYDGYWYETPGYTLTNAIWTHVAFSYDGATLKLYINGDLGKTLDWVGTPSSGELDIYIGKQWEYENYYKGLIDEVRIYNRALTPSEIKALLLSGTITTSEEITVASISADNIIRYQLSDNSFATASVDASNLNNGDSTRIISLKNVTAIPVDDAYFVFGEVGSEAKKFRIISTSRNSEDSVEVTALEHISSLYSSSHASIIVEDIKMSKPVNEMQKPHAPVDVSVLSIEPSEGLGFWLTANPDSQDTMANEVVVQMRRVGSDDDFNTIAIIPKGQNKTKYVDNNLKPNSTYEFKFFSRTKYKTGIPTILTHTLAATGYQPDPPSGLRIKGADPNTSTFSGKDVTIEWNPVGIGGQTDLVDGYVVKVYHTGFSESNKLRESFVKNEYFKYTYEMMIEDSGGTIYGTESDNLIFTVQTRATNGVLSITSDPLFVYNTVPANISSLSSESTVGGVKFYWRKSSEDDHKAYQYKLKVGSGSWSAVSNTEDNSLIRTLNATEITSYGNRAGITFKVKDLDWFGQSSNNWASTCASANTISCDIFRLSISLSASISGTSASLIDGETNSGGVLIP